jgi:hypothetical protein
MLVAFGGMLVVAKRFWRNVGGIVLDSVMDKL